MEGQGYYPLAKALRHVLRSSQPSVWVDCRHVAALPAEALRLLGQCAQQLWQHGGHLVLCHLPAAAKTILAADASQPLAASALDADQYGLDCPEGILA
jgi:anti-anti-sigma regulatory factor